MADDDDEGQMEDWSNQGLWRLDIKPQHADLVTLIADHNCLTKIDSLDKCPNLQQLSLAHNRLLHVSGLSHLQHLSVLNLASNSIVSIEGLENLGELSWLDLSGNSIKDISCISRCVKLRHLELSENNMSELVDLRGLTALRTLLLHGNTLSSLMSAPNCLPPNLCTLSLESNSIEDLTQIACLSFLTNLQQLSVASNPCVDMTANREWFDYRPYVLCCCPSLQVLDGYILNDSERLQAQWLYSQGHIQQMVSGQHTLLVRYLATVCPLTSTEQLQSDVDARVVGSVTKHHQCLPTANPWPQQQQQQQYSNAAQLATRDKDLDPNCNGTTHSSGLSYTDTGGSPQRHSVSPSDRSRLFHPAWTENSSNSAACDKVGRQGHNCQDLLLQDINQEDFDARSSTSLLESESVYLPVTPATPGTPQRPNTAHSSGQLTPAAHTAAGSSEHTVNVPGPRTTQSRPYTSPTRGELHDSKYQLKERRVIKPLNQEIVKGNFVPNFPVTLPLASSTDPSTHVCRDRPSTAASHDYDMSLDASRPSAPSPTSVPAAQVSLIHRVADNRRAAREQQTMRHTPPPGETPPVPQTQTKGGSSKLRVKGLDSNRQAELSKLVKCQQNAERLNQHRTTTPTPTNTLGLSSDSGFLSRPASDAILGDHGQEDHAAATCIQAMWRGYWAREHNVDVVSVRKEIRARRAEDHIVLLRAELDRHKKLYNEEKRLRTLQMEAIRCLYHEVQQLKSQVQHGGVGLMQQGSGNMDVSNGMFSSAPTPTSTTSSLLDSQRTTDLERTCASLQSQVWQLQEALQSMTSVIFRQGSVELSSLSETDHMQSVLVSECLDGDRNQSSSDSQGASCHWSSIPHSLSPYPSEEEETYFRQVPHNGAPTPPRNLGLQHRGEHSVLLHWMPSRVVQAPPSDSRTAVTGYRVFVNDQMKGMISSQQTMAHVTGLSSTATYKFYVKAVSSQGESYESNIVMARLARGSERQQLCDSSDSDVLPDSDKDRDSADLHDKRRLRKRDSRKHRKVRSPRSEKKLPRAGSDTIHGEVEEGVGQEEESQSATGILTQPKLHKHKRTRSKEQNELASLQVDSAPATPSRHGAEGQSVSRNTPTPTRDGTHTPSTQIEAQHGGPVVRDGHTKPKSSSPSLSRLTERPPTNSTESERQRAASTPPMSDSAHSSMSDTFTVDRASSFLRNLGVATPDMAAAVADGRHTPDNSGVKGHHRKRSKDLNTAAVEPTGNLPDAQRERKSPDRGHVVSQMDTKGGEDGAKIRTHRRTRSRDLNTPTPMDDSRKDDVGGSPRYNEDGGTRDKERSNTPVLDGRRRTSSRPSSPMVVDGTGGEQRETDSAAAERRRIPTAELLEQRLSSIKKSTSLTHASGREREPDEGETRSAAQSTHKHSPGSDSLHDSSQEETSRPSLRRRTHSTGSESDLPGAVGGRKEANIVSSLLAKLQVFTRKQESNLKEASSRLRKRSDEEERPRGSGRTRHISESDNDMSSDAGGNLPPRAPVSDSSSGSHSDDNKVARSHRTHRRSPSDQRPQTTSGYSSDQVTGRLTHSPIIMEGAGGKKAGSNVRRNASFHALLPSRPPDSPQPTSVQEETGAAVPGMTRREESVASTAIASPQESQGNPRSSIRSRSPSPSRSRQPVLSGAQLKRQGDSSKT